MISNFISPVLFFLVLLGIPVYLIYLILYLYFKKRLPLQDISDQPNGVAALCGCIGAAYGFFSIFYMVVNTSDPQAGIGLILLPFAILFYFGLLFLGGLFLEKFLYKKPKKIIAYLYLSLSIFLIGGFIYQSGGEYIKSLKANQVRHLLQVELIAFLNEKNHAPYLLAAALENPNINADMIDKIVIDDPLLIPLLIKPIGATPYKNTTGNSLPTLSVMRLIAQHPLTGIHTLERMLFIKRSDILYDIASRPSLPIELLEKIYKENKGESFVESGLARNINTPKWILKELLQSKDEFTRDNAMRTIEELKKWNDPL
jgi:hypothetical protein